MNDTQQTAEDKAWEEKYSEKDYIKTIYSFSATEMAKLTPWDAQIQLGVIAQQVLTGILRKDCLKRVGAKNSPDAGIRYDITAGQFYVYQPKVWCSLCTNKKAQYSVENKVYCAGCIEILKAQQSKQPAKPEAKKEAKK